MSVEKSVQGNGDGNKQPKKEKRYKRAMLIVYDYLYKYAFEENLFTYLKSELERIASNYRLRCGSNWVCLQEITSFEENIRRVVYATVSESARLGAFRVLVNEVYRHVHGKPLRPYEDIALHGYLRERQIQVHHKAACVRWQDQQYRKGAYMGIDYAMLLEYPHPSTKGKVTVPLFIIAKSRTVGEELASFKNAVNEAKQYIQEIKDEETRRRLFTALDNLQRFTRVAVLRAITGKELNSCKAQKDGFIVYPNIACSILCIVFSDIKDVYDIVAGNEHLSELTSGDWFYALLYAVGSPLFIDAGWSDEPPEGDGGWQLQDLPSKINKLLNKALKSSEKHVNMFGKLISNYFEYSFENIIRGYSEREDEERRRLALRT